MPEPRAQGKRELSGPEKAAALLLMMDKPPAGRLLKQFDQSDLRAVARAAAGLGAIPATTLDRIVEEFAAGFSVGADLLGDAGQAKNLLADALPPEQIADILNSELGETNQRDVWQSLARAPESAIIALLMAERAATATYILAKLDPSVATRIIAALPRDRRNAALCGMVKPVDVTPLAAELIEKAVRGALKQAPKSAVGAEGRSRIADIINSLDPEEAEDAMRALEQVRPEEAAILKTMLLRSTICRNCRSGRGRSCSTGPRSTSSSWPCGEPTQNSATLFSPRCPRAAAVSSKASSIPALSRPRKKSPRLARAIADIVLGMASSNEIELGGPAADKPP